MKFIQKLDNSYTKVFIILSILLAVIIGGIHVFYPWSLIDDGYSILTAQQFTQHFINADWKWFIDFDKEFGRFRLGYWTYQWILYLCFGLNVLWYRVFHEIMLIVISLCIFYIGKQVSRSNYVGLLSTFLYLIFAPQAENWIRLGPVEIPFALYNSLFLAIFVHLYTNYQNLTKTKVRLYQGLMILLIIWAVFTKETGAVLGMWIFVPIILMWMFRRKEKIQVIKTLLPILVVTFLMALISRFIIYYFNITGGYGGQYSFTFETIKNVFREFMTLLEGSYGRWYFEGILAFFGFRVVESWWKERQFSDYILLQVILFSFFVLFFAIQLPWPYPQGRYLSPSLMALSVVMAGETVRLIRYIYRFAKLGRFEKAVSLLLGLFLVFNLISILLTNSRQMIALYSDSLYEAKFNQRVVESLALTTAAGGHDWINIHEGGIEFVYEIGYHEKIFYNRPDIKVDFYNLNSPLQSGDVLVTWSRLQKYPDQIVEASLSGRVASSEKIDEWNLTKIK